jgi:hypothetical protein
VEGDDDQRFFDNPRIKLELERKYPEVHIVKYSTIPLDRLAKFLEGVRATESAYIFVRDYDNGECIPGRKSEILQQYARLDLDPERILVVAHEIESWYFAGIGDSFCSRCGLPKLPSTHNLSKSGFDTLIEGKFGSRIDCLVEIIHNFSVQVAKSKNESFAYFCRKFL